MLFNIYTRDNKRILDLFPTIFHIKNYGFKQTKVKLIMEKLFTECCNKAPNILHL